MKDEGRYDVSGLKETQFEPGSGDKVLRNLKGVIDLEEMKLLRTLFPLRTVDLEHAAFGNRYFLSYRGEDV